MTADVKLQPIPLGPLPSYPAISILMSVYNYGHYVGAAIESVLRQSYPRFECIICDDGSTDDSVKVVERYLGDPRLRLFQKTNGGQATALNMGFAKLQGDIVCLLDADDLYASTKLERIVNIMQRNPRSGCVLNASRIVDHELRPLGALPLFGRFPSGWCGPKLLAAAGLLPYMPGTPGMNVRREVAEAIFPLPAEPPLNGFADMLLWRLIPLFSVIEVTYEHLAFIRRHETNTYQRSRITKETIQRELDITIQLWLEQGRRAGQIDPAVGSPLAPLDTASIGLLEQYMHARLTRYAGEHVYHKRLLALLRAQGYGLGYRAFWRAAPYIPSCRFESVINLLFTHNKWKASLSHFV